MLTGNAREWSARRRIDKMCQAKLDDLDLPHPFEWSLLVEQIQAQRGRQLWVVPHEGLPVEITGLWVGCRDRDYVIYRADLVGTQRGVSIGHEFAHIVLKHETANVTDHEFLRRHCPDLADSGTVEHVCMRSDFASVAEREAETLASLLLTQPSRNRRAPFDPAGIDSLSEGARVDSIWRS